MSAHILIVEDDHDLAYQLRELLEFHDYAVDTAENAARAKRLSAANDYDLALVDIMLPDVHGVRVVESLRRQGRGNDMPILLMSGVYPSSSLFRRDIERLGLEGFLAKPFPLMELVQQLGEILGREEHGRAAVRSRLGSTQPTPPSGDPQSEGAIEAGSVLLLPPADPLAQVLPAPEPLNPAVVTDPFADSDLMDSSYQELVDDPFSGPIPKTPPPGSTSPEPSKEPIQLRPTDAFILPEPTEEEEGAFVPVDASRRIPPDGESSPEQYVRMLTTLFHAHSSGQLTLLGGLGERTFHVFNGYPVWVDVPDPHDGFPVFLERERIISPSDRERLRREAGPPNFAISTGLVELRLVPADDLPAIQERWIEAELRSGLAHRGRYRYKAGDDSLIHGRAVEVNPIQAIWSGLSSSLRLEYVEGVLAEVTERKLGKTRTFNRLFGYLIGEPQARELSVFLEQERTVGEVLQAFEDPRGVVRRCLWFLIHAGLVALSDEPEPSGVSTPAAEGSPPPPKPKTYGVDATSSGNHIEHAVDFAPISPTEPGAGPDEPITPTEPEAGPKPPPTAQTGAEAQPPSPEVRTPLGFDEVVEMDYAAKMGLDHYGFLAVSRDASQDEIEAAYATLGPRYRVRSVDGQQVDSGVRTKAKELLSRLLAASEELRNPRRRAHYDSLLGHAAANQDSSTSEGEKADQGDPRATLSGMAVVPEAEGLEWRPCYGRDEELERRCRRLGGQHGRSLEAAHEALEAGKFDQATDILESLRSELPSDPGILTDLGWACFASAPRKERQVERALEWINLALTFKADFREALEAEARVLSFAERFDETRIAIERLLRATPDHSWAKRQLKTLDLGDDEDKDSGKGLRSLFGRKK